MSDHWLVFDADRNITGCHCGFPAEEGDEGYGDSVVAHLQWSLGHLGVVRVDPGDVVVLRTEDHLTMEAIERLGADAKKALPMARVVVLDGGISLGVVRRSELSGEGWDK